MTTLATAPHDDPLHMQAGPDHFWSTVNTAEAMPGVQTPLSWTFWADPLELAMRGCFCDLGVLRASEIVAPPAPDDRYSAIFFGRFAGNVNALRGVGDRMPGTSGDAVEEQIFGRVASGISSKSTARRYPVVALKMPLLARRLPRLMPRLRAEQSEWWRRSVGPEGLRDGADAPALFIEAKRRFQAVMRPHSATTMLAQAMYEQVSGLAEAAGLAGLETSLITGYGEMEEARVATDLWEVSRERLTLEEFVARHGYHGPSEGALASRSWREDDGPLRALVATYRTMSEDSDPSALAKAQTAARVDAERRLLAATPAIKRARTRLILRLAARYIPLREVGKAAFLEAIDVGRAAARAHGAKLAAAGLLADPEDVFYLTAAELEGELAPDAADLVAARRARRDEYLTLRLPDTWTGHPDAISASRDDAEQPDEIDGMAVSPGTVEGRARVVLDPDAGIDIEPGEVLVCQTTDPSWASYFLVASALVIDIGGAMSHGAIVAREMGIPCVINTRVGTQAIRSGDLVRVDGDGGEVKVIERGDETLMANEIGALQAVRLKGRPTAEDVAAALGLPTAEADTLLSELSAAGNVEEANGRFKLTEAGRARRDELLDEERGGIDQAQMQALYEEFTPLNDDFKQIVSDWQLRDGEPNDHQDAAYDEGVLQRLAELHERFAPLVERAAAIAPRLAPYPGRFAGAIERLQAGDHSWFARPMIDSYHTVWFELHEDLMGLAGLERVAEAAEGRA